MAAHRITVEAAAKYALVRMQVSELWQRYQPRMTKKACRMIQQACVRLCRHRWTPADSLILPRLMTMAMGFETAAKYALVR